MFFLVLTVALGIFIATLGGGSFTKYNKYLIGDILSVSPGEIGMLALVLLGVLTGLIVLLGFIISWLMIFSRKREFALMRLLRISSSLSLQ